MTELTKCDAIQCASNKNRTCVRRIISIDEKGRCRQYDPRQRGDRPLMRQGRTTPVNMLSNYQEIQREMDRYRPKPK